MPRSASSGAPSSRQNATAAGKKSSAALGSQAQTPSHRRQLPALPARPGNKPVAAAAPARAQPNVAQVAVQHVVAPEATPEPDVRPDECIDDLDGMSYIYC
jgi:hypothetical protein